MLQLPAVPAPVQQSTKERPNKEPPKSTSKSVQSKENVVTNGESNVKSKSANLKEKENSSDKVDRNEEMRSGFKKTPLGETKSVNRSVEARRNRGLNRSSTAEILKLIKTKSKADFGKSMETVDEDDEEIEIDYLLKQLNEEGLDNIAWDDIGLDEDEVKNIVDMNASSDDEAEVDSKADAPSPSKQVQSSSSEDDDSSSSGSSSEESDSDDEMQHTVFTNHATLNLKPATVPVDNVKSNPSSVKATSTLTTKLSQPKKLEVEEVSSSEEDEETDDSD